MKTNTSYLVRLVTIASVIYLSNSAGCKDKNTTSLQPNCIQLPGNACRYFLGVNYPWLNYGHDFGTTAWGHDGASTDESSKKIDADFAYFKSQGVHVLRWFLFGDCRAAPEFDANGNVIGFDKYFFPDLDTALAIAGKHDIYLVLVLFDFHLADKGEKVNGVYIGGRSLVIAHPATRESFLNNALKPLLERYAKSRNIIAWEVMNEPEGAMTIRGGNWAAESVSAPTMQSFVNDVVGYIHTYSSQHATLGSASRRWLDYWTNSKLDFYQYHYYDKLEKDHPLDHPCAKLKLDKPCILGEFPTRNTKRTMTEYLDTIYNNDHAGALAWSYRASDEVSDFKGSADEFAIWSKAHEAEVIIDLKASTHDRADADTKPGKSISR